MAEFLFLIFQNLTKKLNKDILLDSAKIVFPK
jgi:hypothetical protein